ncbi:MAG: hypothetical protein CML13_07435 [Puniceicoccaceae bacterium]|nr:hypothetical protein [Puniceicoccaceae bacterium]|tara:strand:+ start:2792 stop:3772 length:981 start_codon:yes stop_codon:yes gene_type:complete
MNISNTYARNRALFTVVAISLGLHVLGLIGFGAFKIVESITREEQTFEAPQIVEVPQEQPEYQVNLEQRNRSSAPPRPNPIVVDAPDVTIPALNIDVNIANASSYRRGSGGLGSGTGGGVAEMREMVVADLDFFGAKMQSDAQRILFIIDMSGSMVMSGRGVDGYKKVVDEIIKTLKPMIGVGSFNALAFGGDVDKFRGSSFKDVSEDSIASAHKWLMDRDPAEANDRKPIKGSDVFRNYKKGRHMGTRADLALEEGFKMRPNMIIFLSDGDPTTMEAKDVLKLVDEKLQPDVKVPINAVSYKSSNGRSFLKQLAANSGGTYTEVK